MNATPPQPADAFDRVVENPLVDRVIAVCAVAPWAYAIGTAMQQRPIQIENVLLLIELCLLSVTMLVRRPPVRVTRNPLFWAVALVATYWSFFVGAWAYEAGTQLASERITLAIALIGFAVTVWARLSLGRNIGFVPAERRIVTTGAYAFARHPIYTGLFITIIGLTLSGFSWRNLALDAVWVSLWVCKTFMEEDFLKQSPQYAAYMRQVRWRWFPWVA